MGHILIPYVLMSVVLEYEMYMPRAHLRKGTLRLSVLLLILNILN